jgi:xylulokinase
MLLLGIDCGTQSLKVIAWDPDSRTLTSCSRSYGLIKDLPPGHKEQAPTVWVESLHSCLDELKSAGIDMSSVAAVGVSGQQHGLVLLNSSDHVLRPAKLWNDTSTESQCRQIVEAAGGIEAYQAEIGNYLPPGFTASKILWVRQNEPEVYRDIASIMLPHDYLNFHLTGEKVAEAGDASGTGYFSVEKRDWSKAALSWIDPKVDLYSKLPRLIPSHAPAGILRPELARRWGMNTGVIVSSGGGDNMMGAIGSGNVKAGIMTLSLGTSGTLYCYSSAPVIDPRGEIAAFCDSTGGWLPLGCTMNVTVATEMIRHNFLDCELPDFNRAVDSVGPGSDGLILIPYLEGERMPSVPNGSGVLFGLRPQTAKPAHLARAAMEGVTLGLRYGLDRIKDLGLSPVQVRLIGGGSKSGPWRQIVADVFDTPVVCPAIEEGPAFGAALQAMWAMGEGEVRHIADQFVDLNVESGCEPDPVQVSAYYELYRLYRHLAETLTTSGVFERHRELISRPRETGSCLLDNG